MGVPWFRKDKHAWYFQYEDGSQRSLGKHPDKKPPRPGQKPPRCILEAWEAAMNGEKPKPKVSGELLIPVLCDEFLKHAKATVTEKTWKWYLFFLQSLSSQYPKLRPSSLDEARINDWLDAERKRPWKQTSRCHAITIAKLLLNWAVKNRLIAENPIKDMDRPTPARRERDLTQAERAQILAMFPEGDPFHNLLVALSESGARPGEVIRVTAQDVDFAEGTWTLKEHKTAKKTGKKRVIYMSDRLSELTNKLAKQNPTGPIFLNADGNPWNLNAINDRFERKRKSQSLDKEITAYHFRHAFTTDALENGVPIATVSELLGHTSTEMVSKHYSKLSERKAHLRAAVQQATEKK